MSELEDFKKEALQVIDSLIFCVNYLGGDAYEQECIEKDMNAAYRFLEKHQLPDPVSTQIAPTFFGNHNKIYAKKDEPEIKVRAVCKRHAKNLLHTNLKNVKYSRRSLTHKGNNK